MFTAKLGVLMEKISDNSPEIVFGSSDTRISEAISRRVRSGQLRKLAGRIYTPNMADEPDAIIRRNLYVILGQLYPGAVISHRSALEGGLTENNTLFLTYKYTRKVGLPGVSLRFLAGTGMTETDAPFMDGLYMSSRPRALLENMQPSRARAGDVAKCWSRKSLEHFLDELCRIHGEEILNQLRDEAHEVADRLDMEKEFQKLDALIGAILGTRENEKLTSSVAKARAAGLPYDAHRLELFGTLFSALKQEILPKRPEPDLTKNGLRNIAFFDAYFSNYIEGTEFLVEEAADMVFQNRPMTERPADSHDVIGTFQLVSDKQEMNHLPNSADELIGLLRSRHATLLSARPEKRPGELKEKPNRAGNTVFVEPALVRGTLIKGFEIYRALEDSFARAIFMMFLIAEVHPFTDGNGRLARIMMNAELMHGKRCRIIIPTVYREDYLLALRALSRESRTDPYIRMIDRAQIFVSAIDFNDYEQALVTLRRCNAFSEPSEAKLVIPS